MSSEWPLKRLSEVADFHNHRRVPLKSLDRQKRQGKYPYYGASGVVDHIDDYIFDGVFLLVSEDGENLRTRKTPIAFKTSGKFWVNNHAHILQEKEEGVLDYLEYYFSILDLTPFITGAVQPKLNKANLETIEIPVPPKDERLKINQVLNSFTNKIELNTQINQTLEQIAQALFKSWFVDFDPVKAKIAVLEAGGTAEAAELAAMGTIAAKSPEQLADMQQSQPKAYQQLTQTAALFPAAMQNSELGQIPKGWVVTKISDFGSIICGKTPSKARSDFFGRDIPFIKIPDMHTSMFVVNASEYLSKAGAESQPKKDIPKGSICISSIATVGKVIITIERSQTNQQINSIVPDKSFHTPYLYFYMVLLENHFHDLSSGGSATLNMNTSTFARVNVVKPPDDILLRFHTAVKK